jgi:hypothetical protein
LFTSGIASITRTDARGWESEAGEVVEIVCGETPDEESMWWSEMCRAEEVEGEAVAAAVVDGEVEAEAELEASATREADERGGLLI